MEILARLNTIYETKKFKNLYTYILSGLCFILVVIIPFFVVRKYLFGSFWIDLLIRVLITLWAYGQIYSVSHLDQYYERFYKGARKPINSEPDGIKQIVNILGAVFSGSLGYIVYRSFFGFFIPNIGITGTIISAIFGGLTFLPLLSQYKKR
jgi:hypothetical protein